MERFAAPVPGSVATIVRSFKAESTRQLRRQLGESVTVWQRGFDDRALRTERAMARARRYILENPAKWRAEAPWYEEREYLAALVQSFRVAGPK